MAPPPHTKPENVLKRAQELIGVGQTQAALLILHEHVTSKKTRNSPISSLEPVMILFVELCVDLRKGKSAKDGLYSYKNTAQNTNVGTIELVLSKFINLAERKVGEAQEKALEVQSLSSTTAVDDLEATETPESVLLSTVSGEQSRDRTDRAIVTPWLKFLWETYRTVLDILKNNARLESLYQSTALQAFHFCQKYTRKTEFRRLCELLRNHLQNAAKYQSQVHAINLNDPDTLQRHLDTRFQQLNVAVELELWQEAFRSIEDIHTLLNLSKRPAKPLMMANYFEKLSTVFLVGENYLFHAAAYSRYFNLLRSSAAMVASGQSPKKDNPAVTDAELTKCASFVVLSALAIPVINMSRSRGAVVDIDETRRNRQQRLTNLLGLANPPSRTSIFKDIQVKGLLKRARPEIRDLHDILEVDFHPLSICQKISPILAQIAVDPDTTKYVQPLQQVILARLFQQLSQVYETINLDFVIRLAEFPEPFRVSEAIIEKFLMHGCKKGELGVRIDHAAGALTFDADIFSAAKAAQVSTAANIVDSESGHVQRLQSTPAEVVRAYMSRLAKSLFLACRHVSPSLTELQSEERSVALRRAKIGAGKEHLENVQRREIIENKKQAAASAAAQKKKEEETRSRLKAQEAEIAEAKRIDAQNREREQKRLKEQQAKIQKDEALSAFNELVASGKFKVDPDSINIDELDAQAVRLLKLQQLEREKQELVERLRIVGKRHDHMERALRIEEIKHLGKEYEEQKKRDLALHKQSTEDVLRESRNKHADNVALKKRLIRLVPSYESFRDRVRNERRVQFEKQRRTAERELQQKKEARIKEFRDRRARERQEAEARIMAEKAAEERLRQEAAEKAAIEEERRNRMAEERAKREEDRRILDDKAALQRQREAEAEARQAAKKSGRTERPEVAAAPRLPVAKAGGGWREREMSRPAIQTTNATIENSSFSMNTTDEPPSVPQKQGYVPPHLRRGQGLSGFSTDNTDGSRPWGRLREETSNSSASLQQTREGVTQRALVSSGTETTGREYSSSIPKRNESPPSRTQSPASGSIANTGKYRPGAFSSRRN